MVRRSVSVVVTVLVTLVAVAGPLAAGHVTVHDACAGPSPGGGTATVAVSSDLASGSPVNGYLYGDQGQIPSTTTVDGRGVAELVFDLPEDAGPWYEYIAYDPSASDHPIVSGALNAEDSPTCTGAQLDPAPRTTVDDPVSEEPADDPAPEPEPDVTADQSDDAPPPARSVLEEAISRVETEPGPAATTGSDEPEAVEEDLPGEIDLPAVIGEADDAFGGPVSMGTVPTLVAETITDPGNWWLVPLLVLILLALLARGLWTLIAMPGGPARGELPGWMDPTLPEDDLTYEGEEHRPYCDWDMLVRSPTGWFVARRAVGRRCCRIVLYVSSWVVDRSEDRASRDFEYATRSKTTLQGPRYHLAVADQRRTGRVTFQGLNVGLLAEVLQEWSARRFRADIADDDTRPFWDRVEPLGPDDPLYAVPPHERHHMWVDGRSTTERLTQDAFVEEMTRIHMTVYRRCGDHRVNVWGRSGKEQTVETDCRYCEGWVTRRLCDNHVKAESSGLSSVRDEPMLRYTVNGVDPRTQDSFGVEGGPATAEFNVNEVSAGGITVSKDGEVAFEVDIRGLTVKGDAKITAASHDHREHQVLWGGDGWKHPRGVTPTGATQAYSYDIYVEHNERAAVEGHFPHESGRGGRSTAEVATAHQISLDVDELTRSPKPTAHRPACPHCESPSCACAPEASIRFLRFKDPSVHGIVTVDGRSFALRRPGPDGLWDVTPVQTDRPANATEPAVPAAPSHGG